MNGSSRHLIAQYTDFSDEHGNVKITISLLIGLVGTAVILGTAYSGNFFWSYYYELYFERGPIPYLISFLFAFSMGILILKYLWLKGEKKIYGKNYVMAFGEVIEAIPDTSVDFRERGLSIPETEDQKSILVNRLRKAITRYKKTRSIAAVDEILRAASEVDRDIVESSYSMINFLIWVIPILGFLGTVIGIGSAIGGFENLIGESAGYDAVKEHIGAVTGNLGLAFDTTLLALIYAAIIVFLSALQKKMDEDFLSGVDQFFHDNVMTKLSDLSQDRDMVVPGSSFSSNDELINMRGLLQDINAKIGQGPGDELNQMLQQIRELLESNKDVITYGNKIERLVDTNIELLNKVPDAINNLREVIDRLGRLFSSIYSKDY